MTGNTGAAASAEGCGKFGKGFPGLINSAPRQPFGNRFADSGTTSPASGIIFLRYS